MNTLSHRDVEDKVVALLASGQKMTVSQMADRIGSGLEVKHGQLKHQITQALHKLRRKKRAQVKGLNWSA